MNCNPINPKIFQKKLLLWFDQHGRKHLPWQTDKTPYRVWISEIMLQQTQVNTVIPYFERFLTHFPTVEDLAKASEDKVLHLWTGLGYYQRARNLHKAAKIISEQFSGSLPDELALLETLPGIGRSTAGAILSIAFQKRAAILDGNVKRVLTRIHAFTAWPGEKKAHDYLWELAEYYTPTHRSADFTQAMMDLGATLCTRGQPDCALCPLKKDCLANKQGIAATLPQSKPKKTLPVRSATFIILFKKPHHVLLVKRVNAGVWKGLWSFPEIADSNLDLPAIKRACKVRYSVTAEKTEKLESFRHTFSHYHFDIQPILVHAKKSSAVMDEQQQIWYNLLDNQVIGMPAPVKSLLNKIPVTTP